jgi:Outer membrane protein beta-barrel domain
MWRILLLFAASASLSAVAQAQTPSFNQWAHGTELAALIGGATSSTTTRPVIAGTARWDVTRWVAIEGRGSWFDRGNDASSFSADLGAAINLVAKRPVTPFLGAGFGFYRASFTGGVPAMSDFYRGRVGSPRFDGSIVFTDPALRLAAGVDVIVRRHWTLRPEISMLIVRSGGTGETLVMGGLNVGYRFEDRPITPAR